MAPERQPRFLVVEGPDGAGTTTQAARLADALETRGKRVVRTAEPSEGPVGRLARAHIAGEVDLAPGAAALVFTADRADHDQRVIRPALEHGGWVVCDRYLLSTLAYQGAGGVDRAWIMAVSAGFSVPDVTFVLDVDDSERARRLAERGAGSDRYESGPEATSIATAYRDSVAVLEAHGHRVETITGALTSDDVHARILARLDVLVG